LKHVDYKKYKFSILVIYIIWNVNTEYLDYYLYAKLMNDALKNPMF